jgi:predicted alpha/beta-hydrolase family hydrolase
MTHPFLETVAQALERRGIATLRFQFPYMESRSKRPDPPKLAQATIRAAVAEAARLAPGVPLIAGGRSFGGRMASQAQAASPLPNVRGLAFLGFPLHQPNKPSETRGEHLFDIAIPMLFLQGTRDALAFREVLEPMVSRLGNQATLKLFEEADHSFHIPARTGRKDAGVRDELVDALVRWIDGIVPLQ